MAANRRGGPFRMECGFDIRVCDRRNSRKAASCCGPQAERLSSPAVREIRVVHDTDAFQAEIRRSGEGKVPVLQRKAVAAFGPDVYVLTGNKTAKFGGGQSGTGYVIASRKTHGSISISRTEAEAGKLVIP
jgi:hypothetical protein